MSVHRYREPGSDCERFVWVDDSKLEARIEKIYRVARNAMHSSDAQAMREVLRLIVDLADAERSERSADGDAPTEITAPADPTKSGED